jgi:hypothetical protein
MNGSSDCVRHYVCLYELQFYISWHLHARVVDSWTAWAYKILLHKKPVERKKEKYFIPTALMSNKTQFPKISYNHSDRLCMKCFSIYALCVSTAVQHFMQGSKTLRLAAAPVQTYVTPWYNVTVLSKRSFSTKWIIAVPCLPLPWCIAWQRTIKRITPQTMKSSGHTLGVATLRSAPLPLLASFPARPAVVLPYPTTSHFSNPFHTRGLFIALVKEVASTSETSGNAYQTTRSNNPEESHLHTRRRENLRSHLARSVDHKSCKELGRSIQLVEETPTQKLRATLKSLIY